MSSPLPPDPPPLDDKDVLCPPRPFGLIEVTPETLAQLEAARLILPQIIPLGETHDE